MIKFALWVVLFGYVVRRSDSLWPAVVTHFANSFLLAVLYTEARLH